MFGRDIFNQNWSSLENEIADEWVRRDALRTYQGRTCDQGCSEACGRRCCRRLLAVRCNCFLILLALMCIGLLIALTVMMIVPYYKSKSDKPTTCTTFNADYDPSYMVSCSCPGRFCSSSYPCLTIYVRFTKEGGKQAERMLHADETGGQCSYNPSCSRSVEINIRSVLDYKEKFGMIGATFPCLYNPAKGSNEVIQRRRNSDSSVTHMIVWPIVIALLCVSAVVFISLTCGCKYTCKTDPPRDVKVTAARLHQLGVYTLKQLPPEERQRVLRECAPGPEEEESPTVV